jgi:hypothetical protein
MPGFQIGKVNPAAAKADAIAKAKAATAKAPTAEDAVLIKYISPAECTDRIRIVFDDSGSMVSQIGNAKQGVKEFLRNCVPNQTAVAIHFMNTESWSTKLRSDLPNLSADLEEYHLNSGGTPFFNTLKKALQATPQTTRIVAFTDGAPTDTLNPETGTEIQSNWTDRNTWIQSADIIIKIANSVDGEKCIPIDTVYFGPDNEWSAENTKLLKYLSEKTGGIFLHFDPQKMSFAEAFKYLAPVLRLQLTDGAFRAAVERGEQK